MDLEDSLGCCSIAPSLRLDTEGIWLPENTTGISYPEDGNQVCFEIEDSSYWFHHRNVLIHGLYKKFAQGTRMFDIGGGNGVITKHLTDQGESCILVEPGRTGALNAKRRGVKNVIQSTLQDAGFLIESIENVGLFDVVEHIQDDQLFLKQINQYQKPGSLIFVTVPSLRYLWSNEDVQAGHYRRYSRRSLECLLKSTGYEICYCSCFFSFLTLPVLMVRTIPSLLGLRNKTGLDVAVREHTEPNRFAKSVLRYLMRYETDRILSGKQIRFGSSLIAVAKKSNQN